MFALYQTLSTLRDSCTTRDVERHLASAAFLHACDAYLSDLHPPCTEHERRALAAALRLVCQLVWCPRAVLVHPSHRRERELRRVATEWVVDARRGGGALAAVVRARSADTPSRALVRYVDPTSLRSRLQSLYSDYYDRYTGSDPPLLDALATEYGRMQQKRQHYHASRMHTKTAAFQAFMTTFEQQTDRQRCLVVCKAMSLGYEEADLRVRAEALFWQQVAAQVESGCTATTRKLCRCLVQTLVGMRDESRTSSDTHTKDAAMLPFDPDHVAASLATPTPESDRFDDIQSLFEFVRTEILNSLEARSCLDEDRRRVRCWFAQFAEELAQPASTHADKSIGARFVSFVHTVDHLCAVLLHVRVVPR